MRHYSRSQLIGRESNDNYRRIITSLRRVVFAVIDYFLNARINSVLSLSREESTSWPQFHRRFVYQMIPRSAGDEDSEQQQLSSLQSGRFDALYRTFDRLSTGKKSGNVELAVHGLEAMVERRLSRPVIERRWRRIVSSLMGTDGSGHLSSHLWRWSLLEPIDGSIRFSIIWWVRNVVGVVSMVREEYPDMGSAGMTTEERHLMDLFFDSRSSDERDRWVRRRILPSSIWCSAVWNPEVIQLECLTTFVLLTTEEKQRFEMAPTPDLSPRTLCWPFEPLFKQVYSAFSNVWE